MKNDGCKMLKKDFEGFDKSTLYYIDNGKIVPLDKTTAKSIIMTCEIEGE